MSLIKNTTAKVFSLLIFFIGLSNLQCQTELPEEDLFVINTTGTIHDRPGAYGYINKKGKIVIEPKYDYAYQFSEGLAWVMIEGKFGCIDKSGDMVIEPFKCQPGSFSEGLAAVSIDGKWGYMDKSGEMVIPPKYSSAASFSEGFAKVMLNEKWILIDKKGETHFENQTFGYYSFSEGLISIQEENKWGFMDKTGEVVIEPKFNTPSRFSNGLAPIWIEGDEENYIDRKGRIAFKKNIFVPDGSAPSFSEGFASVMILISRRPLKYKKGFMDTTGKIVIEETNFQFNHSFSDSLAVIRKYIEGSQFREGYIDRSGKIVIEPKYEWAGDFHNGLAWVRINEKYVLINKSGEYVWPPGFDDSE